MLLCKIRPSGWGREVTDIGTIQLDLLLTSVVRVEVLDLLKTEVLASLNRLEGALDAAGDC